MADIFTAAETPNWVWLIVCAFWFFLGMALGGCDTRAERTGA